MARLATSSLGRRCAPNSNRSRPSYIGMDSNIQDHANSSESEYVDSSAPESVLKSSDNVQGGSFSKPSRDATPQTSTFTIDRLPNPTPVPRKVKQLIELGANLALEPIEHVKWNESQMSEYIDSLLQDFVFNPSIFLNKEPCRGTGNLTPYKWTLIDGKSRIEALKQFVRGAIPVYDTDGRPWYYCEAGQKHGQRAVARNIIPVDMKRKFSNKIIVCYEFPNLSVVQRAKVRGRVQSSQAFASNDTASAVTEGLKEIHDSSQGLLIDADWIALAKKLDKTCNLSSKLAFSLRDKSLHIILLCFSNLLEIWRAKSESRSPRLISVDALQGKALKSDLKAHFTSALERFDGLFRPSSELLQFDGHLSQNDFIVASILVSELMDNCQDAELKDGIQQIYRNAKHKSYAETPLDDRTWFYLWKVIKDHQGRYGVSRSSDSPAIDICKNCSTKDKMCDRVKPCCGSCSALGFECQWFSLDEISRNTENACNECRTNHRACSRERPVCDMCRIRKITCSWSDVRYPDTIVDSNVGAHVLGSKSKATFPKSAATLWSPTKKRKQRSKYVGTASKKVRLDKKQPSSDEDEEPDHANQFPVAISHIPIELEGSVNEVLDRDTSRAASLESVGGNDSHSSDHRLLVKRDYRDRPIIGISKESYPGLSQSSSSALNESLQPRSVPVSIRSGPRMTNEDVVTHTFHITPLRDPENDAGDVTYLVPARQTLTSDLAEQAAEETHRAARTINRASQKSAAHAKLSQMNTPKSCATTESRVTTPDRDIDPVISARSQPAVSLMLTSGAHIPTAPVELDSYKQRNCQGVTQSFAAGYTTRNPSADIEGSASASPWTQNVPRPPRAKPLDLMPSNEHTLLPVTSKFVKRASQLTTAAFVAPTGSVHLCANKALTSSGNASTSIPSSSQASLAINRADMSFQFSKPLQTVSGMATAQNITSASPVTLAASVATSLLDSSFKLPGTELNRTQNLREKLKRRREDRE